MELFAHHCVGLDLGRQRDYSALAVLRRSLVRTPHRDPITYNWLIEDHLSLIHLYRFPLRTPYPQVLHEVRSLLSSSDLAPTPWMAGMPTAKPFGARLLFPAHVRSITATRSTLVLDATGAGLPLYDFMRDARTPLPAYILPVSITSGAAITESETCNVPRNILLTTLETLLRSGALQMSGSLPLVPELCRELAHLRLISSPTGRQSLQPARSSQHDDLVFALALAAFANSRLRLPSLPAHHYVSRKTPRLAA